MLFMIPLKSAATAAATVQAKKKSVSDLCQQRPTKAVVCLDGVPRCLTQRNGALAENVVRLDGGEDLLLALRWRGRLGEDFQNVREFQLCLRSGHLL